MCEKVWLKILKGKYHSEDLGVLKATARINILRIK
jgi:hypothetical protein